MTWKEFQIQLLGFNESEKLRLTWERNLTYNLAMSVGMFKKKPSPEQWLSLPFEKVLEPTMTAEEIENLMQKEMEAFENKRKK